MANAATKRLALIGGAVAVVGVGVYLMLSAFNDNLVFFYSPMQVAAKEAAYTAAVQAAAQQAQAKADADAAAVIAAGKAAHLGGVIAAYTTLPVIGLPVKTDMMGGLDSLLSIVQMPSGIPVATVGVNGGENAGLLAAQILGIKYHEVAAALSQYKLKMREKINADDCALQQELKQS